MGNYHNIEYEFIDRTIKLIAQYNSILHQFPFEEQYNYTLTINCLLGLIVMPKEKVITFIPTSKLTKAFKGELGLERSEIGAGIDTLRDLIKALRHSVAHFDINVISEDDKNHIDWLEFKDTENEDILVAKFRADEIIPFLDFYSVCLLKNLKAYQHKLE